MSAAVLIFDEFGFEFPTKVKTLSAGLAESGCDKEHLLAEPRTPVIGEPDDSRMGRANIVALPYV